MPRAQRRGRDVSRWPWHTMVLGEAPATSRADRLDVSRLQDAVLTPLLGIGDMRTTNGSISSAVRAGHLSSNGS